MDSENNFSWNYERAFQRASVPYCTSNQQGALRSNMDDIQTRGEYVTYAIRKMNRMAGRRIATLGHSQGGMITRWSLRFWPNTRRKVNDVIGMAGSNHGSEGGEGELHERLLARLPAAEGRLEVHPALSTRSRRPSSAPQLHRVYTQNDQVVIPPESSAVDGPGRITNVAIQDVCPSDPEEHLGDRHQRRDRLRARDRRPRAAPARLSPARDRPRRLRRAVHAGHQPERPTEPTPARPCAFLAKSIATYPQRRTASRSSAATYG